MATEINQHLVDVSQYLTGKVLEQHLLKSVILNQKLYDEVVRMFDFKNGWEKLDYCNFQKKDPCQGKIIINAQYKDNFMNTEEPPVVCFYWNWLDSKEKIIASSQLGRKSPNDCVDAVELYFKNMLPYIKHTYYDKKIEKDAINDAWGKYGWY